MSVKSGEIEHRVQTEVRVTKTIKQNKPLR